MGQRPLDFLDCGIGGSDPTLRIATGVWDPNQIEQLSGISGAPVFNKTANGLSGLVMRGGLNDRRANIYYLDFVNIAYFIQSVANGGGSSVVSR